MLKGFYRSLFRVCFAVLLLAAYVFSAPGTIHLGNTVPENPSPIAVPPHHYEVSVRLDVPLSLGVVLMSALGVSQYYGMDVIAEKDLKPKSELMPWDRPFAGRYSEWATVVSHYSAVLAVAPLALAGYSLYRDDAGAYDFGAFTLMFAEAIALQNALNQVSRSTQLWPRPYVYAKSGKGAEKARKADGEAYGSFYSGHASAAFTVATFTGEWFSEMYPNSRYKNLVWASSYTLAGAVGILRVVAGKHYPSDVIVGALVGTGVSFGILKLHEICKKKISFWAIPGNISGVLYF